MISAITPQSSEPTREIFLNLPIWAQIVFYLLGAAACLVFAYGFWRRYRKYRSGRSENRWDKLIGRICRAAKTILTNSTVRKGDTLGGVAHTAEQCDVFDLARSVDVVAHLHALTVLLDVRAEVLTDITHEGR